MLIVSHAGSASRLSEKYLPLTSVSCGGRGRAAVRTAIGQSAIPEDYSDACLEASSILATSSVFAHWTASPTLGRASRPAAASA